MLVSLRVSKPISYIENSREEFRERCWHVSLLVVSILVCISMLPLQLVNWLVSMLVN